MSILNIGILAHVDAGKTSLTEQILFQTGVIPSLGSVDDGTSQTDTLELERARGITIKSAVASFQLNDLKVNLIDTPGHGDFIAEVARSLRVLDAVVLVISAVEGVQSQTRRLARAIRAENLPLIVFVNKIDRTGARDTQLLATIRRTLGLRGIALNGVRDLGTPAASVEPVDRESTAWRDELTDFLAEVDEGMIEEFERTGGEIDFGYLESGLQRQISTGEAAPVFFGSARTGVGVLELLTGIPEWFPRPEPSGESSAVASVFKIARSPEGQKIVFVRVFSGTLNVRQQVRITRAESSGDNEQIEERITGIAGFVAGKSKPVRSVGAGDIAALHGLASARIGDLIGDEGAVLDVVPESFPPPAVESIVHPSNPDQMAQLRTALEDLSEQDPLIALRQSNDAGEISLRLYGEVQKEVMRETLTQDYGIEVEFEPSTVIYVERPIGAGEHVEHLGDNENPLLVTAGFRIEPGESGSGVQYRVIASRGSAPPGYYRIIEECAYEALEQGLYGWEVVDCIVSLTDVRSILYSSPLSTAGDFRKLVPFVLIQALAQAGTEVCEPIELLDLEVPPDTVGAVCSALARARGAIQDTYPDGDFHRVVFEIPTSELPEVNEQLPGLTRGEGSWESSFLRYDPLEGDPPIKKRIGPNPLNRTHYFAGLAQG